MALYTEKSNTSDLLLFKAVAVLATALAGRGCEVINLAFNDVIALTDVFGNKRYEIHFIRKKNNSLIEKKTALITGQLEVLVKFLINFFY